MENYFVVLEVPAYTGGHTLRGRSSKRLQKFLVSEMQRGNARVVSHRQDTGVSEELRAHDKISKGFASYILLDLKLNGNDMLNKTGLCSKAAKALKRCTNAFMIEKNNDFSLLGFNL